MTKKLEDDTTNPNGDGNGEPGNPDAANPNPQAGADDTTSTGGDEHQDDATATPTGEPAAADAGDGTQPAPTLKKRFTQYDTGNDQEYVNKLEEGYLNSGQEALNWKRKYEALVNNQPAAAADGAGNGDDGGNGAGTTTPPAQTASLGTTWADQELARRWSDQEREFMGAHPEILTDPQLQEKMGRATAKMAIVLQETNDGRIPELKDSMEAAWNLIKPESSVQADQAQDLAGAAKDANAGAGNGGGGNIPPKPATKQRYSDAQVQVAIRIDPTLAGKSRQEIEEELAKY
jgi:hypothetical protein